MISLVGTPPSARVFHLPGLLGEEIPLEFFIFKNKKGFLPTFKTSWLVVPASRAPRAPGGSGHPGSPLLFMGISAALVKTPLSPKNWGVPSPQQGHCDVPYPGGG